MEDKYTRLIDVGQFARDCGNEGLAETVLVRALEHSNQTFGPESDVSKSIRKDLTDFYLKQARAGKCMDACGILDFDPKSLGSRFKRR
jgi:hypothetical protein